MRHPSCNARMRASAPSHQSTRGFSLVELMVAIALSLLLLTGVVAIFSSSRVAYESTEQLSRVQETGRFALEQMSRHIRSAGFSGCSRQPNYISTALNSSTTLQWNFLQGPVGGYDASGSSWTPALDSAAIAPNAVTGSDVLVVRGPRLDTVPALVTTTMANPQAALAVSSTANISASGDVVMAYSCEGVSFFFATASGNTLLHGVTSTVPGNSVDSTSFPFRRNAEVVPVETVVYYVRASQGSVPAGTNSLWRRVGVADAEELVQGVEQMQVEYGVDTTGDRVVDSYGPATATTNWGRVLAVRIALLVRSIDQYGTDTDRRTYQLFTTTVPAAGDRRLREVFTTTVGIRNRVRVD